MAVTSSQRRLRIAVLKCFTIPPHIAHERGQFDQIFATWIQAATEARNKKHSAGEQVRAEVTGWDVIGKGEFPSDLDQIDALVITGATASAYDEDPWIQKLAQYIQDVYQNHPNVKMYGGCFGHQIISQALLSQYGVEVVKNPKGWEIGVHDVQLTPEFQSFFPKILRSGNMSYQFLHQDEVVTKNASIPPHWISLGSTALCEVQGFLNPGRVLTYQGHPEFDQFINKLSTASLSTSGALSQEQLKGFNLLIDKDDTRDLAGEVFLEFLCPTLVDY